MIEYHENHKKFIEESVKSILKVKQENLHECANSSFFRNLEVHFSHRLIDRSENTTISTNPTDRTLSITALGNEYLIPPQTAFLQSDFKEIQQLCNLGHQYDLIVIDPPWENKSVKRKKSYESLPEHDLKKIPVDRLLAPGGYLVLWITNKPRYMDFARDVLFKVWKVQQIAHWHWVKLTSSGDFVTDMASPHKRPYEPLLIAHRIGDQKSEIPWQKVVCSVPCKEHSRKPPLQEVLFPWLHENTKCLELFARNLSPGWTSWGNEVLKFQSTEYFDIEENDIK